MKTDPSIVTVEAPARTADARRGLSVVRSLPEALEHAFRAAAREAAFVRDEGETGDATFVEGMCASAFFHFDRTLYAPFDVAHAERARAELALWIRRFSTSRLRRRIAALPIRSLHLTDERAIDLIAIGADEKCYAIRFVAFRSRSDLLAVVRTVRATSPHVDCLIVSSLDDNILRRYTLAPSKPVLVANERGSTSREMWLRTPAARPFH